MVRTLLLTLLSAYQSHAATPDYYTAAVVELATPHYPNYTGDEVLLANAAIYADYMLNASIHMVDIIVFPEGGLHGHNNARRSIELPSPSANAIPCDDTTNFHKALVLLSCATKKFKLYAVVNFGEEYYNSTMNKTEYYNSNVVFDRSGTVVARYRKYNPYGEAVTKPALDLHTFDTDFGITFGTFTCFDIEFMEPGVVLARDYGVRHFAFPHCWISELPFLTAIQAQWGWAYSLDAVLLASGCNSPSSGGSGSGIYHGRRGALQYFQTNDQTSRLLISQISKINFSQIETMMQRATYEVPEAHRLSVESSSLEIHLLDEEQSRASQSNSSLFLLRDYTDVYKSRLLLPTGDAKYYATGNTSNSSVEVTLTTETTLCQETLCCDFQVKVTSTLNGTRPRGVPRGDDFTRQFYRLVAFDGVRWYGGGIATGGVQICGIVPCVNESISSCGLRADDSSAQVAAYGQLYKTGTVFEAISITGNFIYNNTFVYPNILTTGTGDNFGALVSTDVFSYETFGPYNGSIIASLQVDSSLSNLITAAIYARQFDRDGQKRTELPTTSFAHSLPQSIVFICILFLFFFNIILSWAV